MQPKDIQYDKLDQLWAQYDDCAQSVCQCNALSLIKQLKRFVSFLEKNELFIDFNQHCLPQVDFEHWFQEKRRKITSLVKGNGSLFPRDQKERLAVQLCTLHAIVHETLPLQSFCKELLCKDQEEVTKGVFITKVFQPFAVEYKWEVKHQTRYQQQHSPSQEKEPEKQEPSAHTEAEVLQDLAFIITGYPAQDILHQDLIKVIRRSCYRSDVRIICAEDIETTDGITEQGLPYLYSACFVICDVSKDHTRLHQAIDYADDRHQCIIILIRDGNDLIRINKNVTLIRYCNLIDLESQLNRKIKDIVKLNSQGK